MTVPLGDSGVRSGARKLARAVLLALLAGGLLALGAPALGGSGLYRYVDERGVVHFSNVPNDRRYTPIRSLPQLATRSSADYVAPVVSYDDLIARVSKRHQVPPALVKAVIHAESAFDPRAVSPKGAMGLMQLMPDTAKLLGVHEPFRADANVQGGTRYLRALHDRYGSWTHTLAAYNAGPSAVDRYQGVPPYRETREYVKRVLSYYRRYHVDFPR